jgi:rhodanese-related sulfurtransferase
MSAIDRVLAEARGDVARPTPHQAAEQASGGALLIDTRPVAQRQRDGEIPGAVVIERNVLEWRLDPTSPHRIPEITGHHQPIIVVCDQGYSSSLAAASLRSLGLLNATDLDGGFQAWAAAGLPVHRGDTEDNGA